jgi:hypothetical protein
MQAAQRNGCISAWVFGTEICSKIKFARALKLALWYPEIQLLSGMLTGG